MTRLQRTILGNIQTKSPCSACGGEGKTYSQKCTKCSGSGIIRANVKLKVKIPAGINEGESIRLSGQGEAGLKGAPAGDLFLKVKIEPSKYFVRDGYDIRTEATISIKQAILGDKYPRNRTWHSKIENSEGTQSGTTFKIKEKGCQIAWSWSRRPLCPHYCQYSKTLVKSKKISWPKLIFNLILSAFLLTFRLKMLQYK